MKYDLFEGLDEQPETEQSTDAQVDEAQVRSLLDGLLEESRLCIKPRKIIRSCLISR